MPFLKKNIFLFICLILIKVSFFSIDLPNGYKNIQLGMTLDETKQSLLEDSDFGYKGDRDVSLLPGQNRILIETDTQSKYSLSFLTQCWFQFYDDKLFIITININPEKMDYYSIFTKLTEKYGKPNKLNPNSASWENDDVTMSLEKPLTLKYIENNIFKETQNYSNINKAPEEKTREMFLEEL